MAYWLLKTEPDIYGWDDLVSDGKTTWDGVKGGLALKNLAKMRPGDGAFIYHTGREKQIVGMAEVVGEPYPDSSQPDSKINMVDLVPVSSLERPVTLRELKNRAGEHSSKGTPNLWEGWDLLRIHRLSVVPVSEEQWEAILKISQSP